MSTIQQQLIDRIVRLEQQIADLRSNERPLTRIKAHAFVSSGASLIVTNGDPIEYDTIVFDTTNAITYTPGSSWLYTIPVQGTYLVSAAFSPENIPTDYASVFIRQWLYINGVQNALLGTKEPTSSENTIQIHGTILIPCSIGDVLELRIETDHAGLAVTLDRVSYISIMLIA